MFSFKGKGKFNHQSIVTGITITIVFFVVDLYITLLSEGYNFADLFSFLNNHALSVGVAATVQMIILGGFYKVLRCGVNFVYHQIWKAKNKDIWLDGYWLHIHDKKDPKIGVVKIRQRFYDLEVSAVNIKPNSRYPERQ